MANEKNFSFDEQGNPLYLPVNHDDWEDYTEAYPELSNEDEPEAPFRFDNTIQATRNEELITRSREAGQLDAQPDTSPDATPFGTDKDGKVSTRYIKLPRTAGRVLWPQDTWVLANLISKSNIQTGESAILEETLADLTGIPERTLRNILYRLWDAGFITIRQERIASDSNPTGWATKNFYKVFIPFERYVCIDTSLFTLGDNVPFINEHRPRFMGTLMMIKCMCDEGTNWCPYSSKRLSQLVKAGITRTLEFVQWGEHFKWLQRKERSIKGKKVNGIYVHIDALNLDLQTAPAPLPVEIPVEPEYISSGRINFYGLFAPIIYRAVHEWCTSKGIPCPDYEFNALAHLHRMAERAMRNQASQMGHKDYTCADLYTGTLRGLPAIDVQVKNLLGTIKGITSSTVIPTLSYLTHRLQPC